LRAACPVWVDVGHEACSLEPFEAVELEVGRLFLPREGQGSPTTADDAR
jgi:hypothetical protein